MAYAIVNFGQANTASLTIAAATANNGLAAYILQSGSSSPPTITGYTQGSTSASSASSTTGIFFFTKTAAGGETTIAPTPGSGGTIQAVLYWEISGWVSTVYLDGNPTSASNIATATTYTSPGITTLNAASILLACSTTGTNLNGGQAAWTGTGPMTLNPSGVPSRFQIGGSYIPGVTLSGATFTANWTTSRVSGFLLYAIRPTAPPVIPGIPPAFL
jgi:hypothetical protein